MRRFREWFNEPVEMPRAWLYLALAFAFLAFCDLVADLIVWLA